MKHSLIVTPSLSIIQECEQNGRPHALSQAIPCEHQSGSLVCTDLQILASIFQSCAQLSVHCESGKEKPTTGEIRRIFLIRRQYQIGAMV